MKFAGAVVLYNPEQEVLDNMQTYLPFLDVLYVIDNSTKEYDFLENIQKIKKVKYISLNGNQGIAKALKVATETAINDGYDFLLSMDQDSKFPTKDFQYVKDYLENNDVSNLGVIAINYSGSPIKCEVDDKFKIIEVNDVITSGAFVNLNNYKKIDGYNENLFIDYVDNDLCYQFKINKFRVELFPNIFLNHKLGNIQHVKFLWYDKDIVMHSPLRYYYMYRNFNYLRKFRNKDYVDLLNSKKKDIGIKYIFRRFLFEKPHFKILKMIRQGIHDGKRGILGPYNNRRKVI